MFNSKTMQALKKQQSIFSASLILLLLFTQVSSLALARPSTHVGSPTDYRRALNHERSKMSIARSVLAAAVTSDGAGHPENVREVSHEEYADSVFASIVSEFADQDTYVAPTFVAEDGSEVNSVVFDDVGPCVPVLIPATESV